MYQLNVTIEGSLPLLMNRMPLPSETDSDSFTKVSGARDFSQEARLKMYRTEDDLLCQPAIHIHTAMIGAATAFRIKGGGRKSYKNLIQAAILINPSEIIHENQEVVMDQRWVRIGTARVVRERPCLKDWSLSFGITVIDDQIPPEVVKEILEEAGRMKGIGDYRPIFGRFNVTKFEEVDDPLVEATLAAD